MCVDTSKGIKKYIMNNKTGLLASVNDEISFQKTNPYDKIFESLGNHSKLGRNKNNFSIERLTLKNHILGILCGRRLH